MKRFIALLAMFGLAFFMFAAPVAADEAVPCGTPAKAAVYEEILHPAVPAVTETIPGEDGVWANWAPNDTQGPQDYVPDWPVDNPEGEPRGTWILHDQLPPGHEGPDGVYRKGEGNSPYFYRQAPVAEKVVVVTPAKEAWTEKRLVSKAVPAGEPCEKPRTNKPVVDPTPDVQEPQRGAQAPEKTPVAVPVEVPTAVAAGLAAAETDDGVDIGDLVLGFVIGVVLAGATLLFTRRSRGDHQS